jgi:hypothetical protein
MDLKARIGYGVAIGIGVLTSTLLIRGLSTLSQYPSPANLHEEALVRQANGNVLFGSLGLVYLVVVCVSALRRVWFENNPDPSAAIEPAQPVKENAGEPAPAFQESSLVEAPPAPAVPAIAIASQDAPAISPAPAAASTVPDAGHIEIESRMQARRQAVARRRQKVALAVALAVAAGLALMIVMASIR